jgi:hypothetical protein
MKTTRHNRLLPPSVLETLPAWRATANEDDPIATVKLFLPDTAWTWYIVEFDGDDTCFGLVIGHEVEAGYFLLSELEALRSPLLRLLVERDLYFKPTPLSELRRMHAD